MVGHGPKGYLILNNNKRMHDKKLVTRSLSKIYIKKAYDIHRLLNIHIMRSLLNIHK